MPTYDYICTSCDHAWELEQRIVEDPVRKCPKCGKETAKRQISSGAGFILKGGGWYADGYGSKKSSSTESKSEGAASPGKSDKSEKSDTDTKKSESSSDSTKSESKSESKPGGGESKPSAA